MLDVKVYEIRATISKINNLMKRSAILYFVIDLMYVV